MSRSLPRLLEAAARNALLPCLTLLFLASLAIGIFDLLYQPSYVIGDWLINPSQGFVRRGLPGQTFLLLGHWFHVPVPWVALIVPASLYAAFLVGVYCLAHPLKRSFLWFAMLFSPATLPFLVLNCLDIGYRKETLILASLVMFILLLKAGISDGLLSLVLIGVFSVLLLSHEAMTACLPYFFAAVAIHTQKLKRAVEICLVPFLVAAVLLVVVSRHPGDTAVASGICSSVGGHWVALEPGQMFPGMDYDYSLCSGSIAWLGVTLSGYHQQMQMEMIGFTRLFAVLVVFAFLPFCLTLSILYRRDKLRYDVQVIGGTALVSSIGMLGLFYSTIDWGRWLYMESTCLLLVVLMAAQRAPSFRPSDKVPTFGRRNALAALLTLIYCISWTVPTSGLLRLHYGYAQAVYYTNKSARSRLYWNAKNKIGLYGEPAASPR